MWQILYISWPANTTFYWQFLQITETASLWIANSEIIGQFFCGAEAYRVAAT